MTKLIVIYRNFAGAAKNVNDRFEAVLLPTPAQIINFLFIVKNLSCQKYRNE
jgi:hypothetical protein